MKDRQIQKISLAFSLLAFFILIIVSWLSGARWITSFLRAGIASIVLGLIVWGLGSMVLGKYEDEQEDSAEKEPEKDPKGENINKVV